MKVLIIDLLVFSCLNDVRDSHQAVPLHEAFTPLHAAV